MFEEAHQIYTDWVVETTDPRSASWPLMSSPWAMAAISAGYLWIVTQSPSWLANQKPMQLRPIMVVYNLFMSLLSLYMAVEFYLTTVAQPGFNLLCNACDYSDDPIAIRVSKVSWWFFFSKIIEISDTVFMILKKKEGQLSFLHIYHHCTVIPFAWCHVRYIPGGTSYFMVIFNCSVHVFMYFYYFLAACGPSMQRFLGWKRLVTILQMTQFFCVMLHCLVSLFIRDCAFSMGWRVFLTVYAFILLVLFVDFYRKAYDTKSKVKPAKYQQNGSVSHSQNGTVGGKKTHNNNNTQYSGVKHKGKDAVNGKKRN